MRAERLLVPLVLTLLLVPAPGALAHTGTHDAPTRNDYDADPPTILGPSNGTQAALQAAADAGLFGELNRTGSTLQGSLVTATLDTEAESTTLRDLTLDGTRLLTSLTAELTNTTLHEEGPTVHASGDDGALTVHDNRYGWVTVRGRDPGNVTLELPAGTLAANGTENVGTHMTYEVDDTTVHVVRLDGENLTVEDDTIRAPNDGFLSLAIATDPGVLDAPNHDVDTGPWVLAARAGNTTVADVLRPMGTPHRVTNVTPDALSLHVVASFTLDTVSRVETVGIHAPDAPQRYLVHRGDHIHRNVSSEDLWAAGTGSSLQATSIQDEVVTFLVRSPGGQVGDVELVRDTDAPAVTDVLTRNLGGTWSPNQEEPALLVLKVSEAATSRVRFCAEAGDCFIKAVHQPVLEHRFRLTSGFDANRTYRYTVNLTDLAGRTGTFNGSLTLPPAPDPEDLNVTILEPAEDARLPEGSVTVHALVQGQGTLNVFVDKARVPRDLVTREGNEVYVTTQHLSAGAHEVTVELTTGTERVWDRVNVLVEIPGEGEPAEPIPAPGALATLTALLATAGVTAAARGLRRRG